MPQDRPADRSRIATALDVLAIVAALITAIIAITGGLSFFVSGYLISAHRFDRSLNVFLVVLALRLFLFGRRGRWHFLVSPSRFSDLRTRVRAWCGRDRLEPSAAVPLPLIAPHTLWAFLGICAFAVVFLQRQMTFLYGVPDLGDPLLSIWRMSWANHWLHGDPRPLFSPNIFYPETLTLTYSDSMLLPAFTAGPLLALGVHPVVAYNLLFMSGFIFSGWAMYLLAAHLTGSPRAAFVSALLFGFYPFRFEHYSHLELQMTQWMPLALLALHKFLETPRMRYAIGAALAVVAQLYSSMYFAVFFCIYAVPVIGVLAFVRGLRARAMWRQAVIAGVIAVLLAIPLMRPYLAAQARKGERDIAAVTFFSATFKDYISAHPRSMTWYGVTPHPEPERALFPGAVSLTLAAVALVPPLGAVRLAYAAGTLVAFESSRGFHGVIYPLLYKFFLPIRGMRVAARFSLLVGMTLALLAGFGAARLLGWFRNRARSTAVFGLLLALAYIDLRANLDLVPVWKEPPAIYTTLVGKRDVVLAEFPWWSDGGFTPQMPLMYFSIWHWANMVNGSSGFSPPDYDRFLFSIHLFPDDASIDALKARGVTHVTVNCAIYGPDRDCHGVLDKLDGSEHFRPLASARWEGDIVKLYALVK